MTWLSPYLRGGANQNPTPGTSLLQGGDGGPNGDGPRGRQWLLAGLLDQFSNPNSRETGPLQQVLQRRPDATVREAWDDVSPQTRQQIQQGLGHHHVRAVFSLSEENDAELFSQDLFALGRQLQSDGNILGAQVLFGSISQLGQSQANTSEILALSTPQVQEAGDRYQVLTGQGGSLGRQLEFQGERFIDGATDPTMVLGMAVGSSVFTGARSLILPRVMRWGGTFSRVPFATRLTASTLATIPEIGAFWATSKGIQEFMAPGSTRWDLQTNLHEISALGITLGFLKSSGFVFGRLAQATGSRHPGLWQQAGMLTGIMGGHGTEMAVGLRPQQSFGNFLTDSLVMWAQFNAGGALSHQIFPGIYRVNARLNQRMALQEAQQFQNLALGNRFRAMEAALGEWLFGPGGPGGNGMVPVGARASISDRLLWNRYFGEGRPSHPLGNHVAMSVENGEGNGSGQPGNGTRGSGETRPGAAPPRTIAAEQPEESKATSSTPPDTQPSGRMTTQAAASIVTPPPSSPRPGNPFGVLHPEMAAAVFRAGLPSRDGGELAPFERRGSEQSFARDMLTRLLNKSYEAEESSETSDRVEGPLRAVQAVVNELGLNGRSREEIDPQALNHTPDEDFGFAVGATMRRGMDIFFNSPHIESMEGKRLQDLRDPDFRNVVRTLDNLMDVALYAPRTEHQGFQEGLEVGLGERGVTRLEDLKSGLISLLSPQVGRDIISPEEGALSHGYGAMSGYLALLRHRIMPGALSWRYQLFTIGPNPKTAEGLRTTGRYDKKLGANVVSNYREDPFILSVGPDGFQGMTQEMLTRSFQLQMFNVKSSLLHTILTPEYIQSLPKDTHIFESIGGWIGEDSRGIFNEYLAHKINQRTLLPYEFINYAMERYRRQDVEVVTGPGFLPADYLWLHRPVRMAFAGREFPAGRRHSPAATRLARLFAGLGDTPYIEEVGVTHHQHSSELGKAMKNIASVLAGMMAVDFSRSNRGKALEERDFRAALQLDIIEPMETLLLNTLGSEGIIKQSRLSFRSEVMEDLHSCLGLDLARIRTLYEEALTSDAVPLYDSERFVESWVMDNILRIRKQFAPTRNPVMGLVLGIARTINAERGGTLSIPEIVRIIGDKKLLTTEGTDSLQPFVRRNQFNEHPIELRNIDSRIVDLYNLIYPNDPIVPSPSIPEQILQAFRGEFSFINIDHLRAALNGKSQESINLLAEELDRYQRMQRQSIQEPDNLYLKRLLTREEQLIPRLIASMSIRDPFVGDPRAVYDFPVYQDPYENVVRIRMPDVEIGPNQTVRPYYSYLRVNGPGIMDRLTLLGMYLRSFGSAPRIFLDIETTGLESRDSHQHIWEIENTIPWILGAYQARDPDARIRINHNGNKINPVNYTRADFNRLAFYRGLEPLLERLNRMDPNTSIDGSRVNEVRKNTGNLLDSMLQREAGWPSLVKYYAGPIQRAIKSGLTRPEKQAMIGVYSGGQLQEAFMVFRGRDGNPRALNHSVFKKFTEAFPDRYGEDSLAGRPRQEQALSMHYFEGLPLREFLETFEQLHSRESQDDLNYRLIDVQSLPIEMAMAGKIDGVNPAVLRAFLTMAPVDQRKNMYRDLENYYEEPAEVSEPATRNILQRYLTPFYNQTHEMLEQHRPYRILYEAIEKYGRRGYQVLVLRGTDNRLIGRPTEVPPPRSRQEPPADD